MKQLKHWKRNRARRGVALELGISVMLIAVAMSIILITVALYQHQNANTAWENTEKELAVAEIGESFVSAVCQAQSLDDWASGVQGYTAEVTESTEGGTARAMLELKQYNGKQALFVALERTPGAEHYVITAWEIRA